MVFFPLRECMCELLNAPLNQSFWRLRSVAPLPGRLAVQPLKLAAELRGALIAHAPGCFRHSLTFGNLHRGMVQPHGFHELYRGHCRRFLKPPMEHRAAHADMTSHIVNGDLLVQVGREVKLGLDRPKERNGSAPDGG